MRRAGAAKGTLVDHAGRARQRAKESAQRIQHKRFFSPALRAVATSVPGAFFFRGARPGLRAYVAPAQAGAQFRVCAEDWVPAFAGTTTRKYEASQLLVHRKDLPLFFRATAQESRRDESG